jgi:hypothetical protein
VTDFIQRSNTSYKTDITYDYQINVYACNADNLWIACGVAIFVTLPSLGVRFYALYSNGASYRTSSSTIVATTRNRVLDARMIGSSLRADPMWRDVMQTRLRFGTFDADRNDAVGGEGAETQYPKAGFGLETQTRSLKKSQFCY